MNVLVAVASKHGSTREIATAIATELRAMGITADIHTIGEVDDLARYDAVICGSAVYMGRWLPAARQFVAAHQAMLRAMPVWLFSSGPVGSDRPVPPGEPEQLVQLVQATGARGHRTFAGKLAPDTLGFGERVVTRAIRAPAGDFRDWAAIRDWAGAIGATLRERAEQASSPPVPPYDTRQEGTA